MRAAPILLGFLFLAPLAAANHEGLILTAARLDSVFEPVESVGSRWDITFSARNDGDSAVATGLRIHEAPIVFDLMYTEWAENVVVAPGETITRTVRIDHALPGVIYFSPVDWLCLDIFAVEQMRCWSVLNGPALPDGTYPDDLPHWQLGDTPMGDME